MIRTREFTLSAASLAGLSLATGCAQSPDGSWHGVAMIDSSGNTYELPFSFAGTTSGSGWFGTYTNDFETYTMDMDVEIETNDRAVFSSTLRKVYTYTYIYGESSYVYDIEREQNRTYEGTILRIDDRQFNIVMDKSNAEDVFVVNGEDMIPEEEEVSLTTPSMVFSCAFDGDAMHCDSAGSMIVFEK